MMSRWPSFCTIASLSPVASSTIWSRSPVVVPVATNTVVLVAPGGKVVTVGSIVVEHAASANAPIRSVAAGAARRRCFKR